MNMHQTHRYAIGTLTNIDILLIGFGVYWLCMLPSLFSDAPVSQAATRILLLPAVCVMYWSTIDKINQMARATAVLGNLRAPAGLWKQLSTDGMQRVRLIWALFATGTTLQLALPGSATPPIAGAALMSLIGLAALLHSVARAGVFPFRSRTVDLVLLALVVALLISRPASAFAWFAALPDTVLALIVIAFPITLALLERRWRVSAAAYRWRQPQPSYSLIDDALAHLRRYTVLMYNPSSATLGWSAQKQTANPAHLFFTLLPLLATISGPIATYNDGKMQLVRVVSLMMLTMCVASGLVVRDLHWRSFLMSGGLRKNRIGSSMFATTLLIQYGLLALLLGVAVIWNQTSTGGSPEALLALIKRHATLPLEIALSTSIAVALRPLAKSHVWLVLCIAGIMVGTSMSSALASLTEGTIALSLPLYASVLAATSAVLVVISNRLWTMKRLFDISGWNKTG